MSIRMVAGFAEIAEKESEFAELTINASAVSDAPHYKSAGRFRKSCGARPRKPPVGRHLCKLNGVRLMRKASGRGSGIKKRAGRIGGVVVCVGVGRAFEARLETRSWFGGKKGAPRWQVVRGTG